MPHNSDASRYDSFFTIVIGGVGYFLLDPHCQWRWDTPTAGQEHNHFLDRLVLPGVGDLLGPFQVQAVPPRSADRSVSMTARDAGNEMCHHPSAITGPIP